MINYIEKKNKNPLTRNASAGLSLSDKPLYATAIGAITNIA
jgi:hypothetical protein